MLVANGQNMLSQPAGGPECSVNVWAIKTEELRRMHEKDTLTLGKEHQLAEKKKLAGARGLIQFLS